jgi:adhesin/invasin
MLRLVNATVGPVSIAPGSNGVNQTVQAYNAGDGTLSLSLTSSVTWITPNVGAGGACPATVTASSCTPLILGLNTASLAASTTPYTGIVTVNGASGTVDAPQAITVTVLIGGAVPPTVNVYVAPGSAANVPFTTNSYLTGKVTTQDGAKWLSLLLSGAGSNQFSYPYTINIAPQSSNTAGNTYTGAIVTSGSTFAPDNKTISVTMNVTSQPIAQPSTAQITEQLAVGAPVGYGVVTLSNSGQGTLTISGVTATGSGITTTTSGSTVLVAFNPAGLSPQTYTGSVSIASNAVNSPTTVPVTFQVVAAGAPTVFYHGVVDDAVFAGSGFTVAPGDVMALFGDQLSFQAPDVGPQPPLAPTLGGSSVTVNGEAAPLYFSSYGQINFQMPVDAVSGEALVQVTTSGQTSNLVSVNVASRAPRLLLLGSGYGAILDASKSNGTGVDLPLPPNITFAGFISQPAAPGDVLTIFAIGLGPTSPSVATGQPAPAAEPLARLTVVPTVNFGLNLLGLPVQVTATPTFAGLSPNFAGLYQVNVAIPSNCPAGTVQVSLTFPDSTSNSVNIQVQ